MVNPNVLLVVMDATRADHTSVHGYERDTTPNLVELAADGYQFDNAFSAAPWTPPSHGSIFGGVHPTTHGFLDIGMPYRPPHPPLAERLQEEGYYTFGAVQNSNITSETELTRGFEDYCDLYRLPFVPETFEELRSYYLDLVPGYVRMAWEMRVGDRKPGEYLTSEYIKTRIRRSAGTQSFFGFINLLAPHTKYAPPKSYRREFNRGPHPDTDDELVTEMSHNGGYRYMAGEVEPSEADWAALTDLYDGEIAFADAILGKLLDTLKKAGVYDETLVIVTGDHGEHFGEHELAYHQFSLFDELLHVPLVVKPPGTSTGHRVEDMVSLVDIYPTVLSELELDVPKTIEGQNLFDDRDREAVFAEFGDPVTGISTLKNHTADPDEELLAELDHALQCARTTDEKYLRVHGGEDKVYDVGSGYPKDTLKHTGRHERLAQLVSERLGDDLGVETVDPEDPKIVENLKALGYR
ncbi:sulfatase [Haloarcula sp. H-GB5]